MRKLLILILGIVVVALMTPFSWAQQKAVVGLSVAKTFEFMPVNIGKELGFWKKRGIDVEIVTFRGDSDLQQAMAAGSVDFGLGSGVGASGVIAKGVPIKIVYAISNNPGLMVVIAGKDSGINNLRDLKGKTIGIPRHNSLPDWIAKRLCKEMGWDIEKGMVRVPLGGFREQVAALQTRQSDGFIWSADGGYELEEKGMGKIIVSIGEYVKDFLFEQIQAPTALIEKDATKVKQFLEGWAETTAYMKKNKEKTIELLAKYLEVSPEVARKVYDLDMKNMSVTGEVNRNALKAVADSLVEMNIVKEAPPIDKLYTDKFTPVKF
jgi:ABC-type nitrate/sulfonate/bicarbonate transport system substrate-binding protein